MPTSSPTVSRVPPLRRSWFNRYTIISFVAGATLIAGVGAFARVAGMGDGPHSAADMPAHVDHMLKHLYVELDATDAQKAQIDPLVQAAVNDLLPLHSQLHSAHAHAIQALGQATVDRAALESARAEHLQLADQASKRLVQLIADVGDVLTPAQRQALVIHVQRMHGMPPS